MSNSEYSRLKSLLQCFVLDFVSELKLKFDTPCQPLSADEVGWYFLLDGALHDYIVVHCTKLQSTDL